MSPPLLSVVMPVFNAGRCLGRALESVLTQSVESVEVMCIDEGSSDNSAEVLSAWASRDKRVRVLTKKNPGLGAARNCGLDHALGQYVVFVDADDLLLPGAFKHMLAEVRDSDVLVYDFIKFKNEKDPPVNLTEDIEPAKVVPRDNLLLMMGVVWNKLVRRKWLEDAAVRFPEGSLYEDIPVHWKLIILAERIRYLESPLYALRVHSASTTARAGIRMVESVDAFHMVEEFLHLGGKWDQYKDVFEFCRLTNLARVYDTLSELGAEPVARAALDAAFGAEQRVALRKLPLLWRDRDVFLAMEGDRIAKTRRMVFKQLRKTYRICKKFIGSC